MKKKLFLNLLLALLIVISLSGCKKTYKPETREELKALVDNESISLGDINTSKITDMSRLFQDSTRDNFTGIENWDVSNVTNMSGLFYGATKFNSDISKWDTSNVRNMGGMFSVAKSFNQNISNWNVSNVVEMGSMFFGAESFNQDLSNWNVSNVKSMGYMFLGTPLSKNPPAWYKE